LNSRGDLRIAKLRLTVNGRSRSVDVFDADGPLLWVLRDGLGLTGTKYGCGMGVCGACTIHLDGEAVQACQIPVSRAAGRRVTTIEGLSSDGRHPCQRAWLDADVAQCGYCQPGMIMEAAALLDAKAGAERIEKALSSHVCRCGTYARIRRAVAAAVAEGASR
jgi:isoquinoline 1-oxidoreductase subunit alpha